ncbi:vacuolar alkaline phosphatase [Rhizina undulata]
MSQPLLESSRPSSDNSDDRTDVEDALLTGQPTSSRRSERCKYLHWTHIGLGIWAGLATVGVVVIAVLWSRSGDGSSPFPPIGKRNVVFMVSDGMGPTSLEMTRSFRQHVDGLPWDDTLFLDKHHIGTSRTRSSNSLVTDSAAGATAFSCAMKSYNGAISVLPGGAPCGTVLEAAKKAGYMTGLVVTTRITDATPACFSAHVHMRGEEDRIAEQQLGDYPLGRVVDLMLGGGRCHFLPNTTQGSCRKDDRDLVAEAQKKYGFTYAEDRAQFDSLVSHSGKIQLPLLGLFANGDIPYELDRRDEDYPSLHEMAALAIKVLEEATVGSEKGFFLMVEGSRIDHAGHGNDPAAQVHEVLEFDRTFEHIYNWVESTDVDSVLVSTSDHETGGLAAARQLHESYPDYLWYPQVLGNATHSAEYLSALYAKYAGDDEDEYLENSILGPLGVTDVSMDELENLKSHKSFSAYVLADMISRRAQIGWSTHGHSAVDVNIYGTKVAKKILDGNHENTEVGDFLRNYLEVDVEAITKQLQKEGVGKVRVQGGEDVGWMGRTLEQLGKGGLVVDEVDCYHGDFKHKH